MTAAEAPGTPSLPPRTKAASCPCVGQGYDGSICCSATVAAEIERELLQAAARLDAVALRIAELEREIATWIRRADKTWHEKHLIERAEQAERELAEARALLTRIANASVIFPSMCANNNEAYWINAKLAVYKSAPLKEG